MSRTLGSRILAASRWVDRGVNLLKWPVALVAAYLLPKCFFALLGELKGVLGSPIKVFPLVAGFAGYLGLWWAWLRRRPFGTFFSTLEHELTHALFALLTLHPVTGLSATWSRGGRMYYRGDGNWLVAIAPYFFPTAAVAVLLVSAFLKQEWQPAAQGVLGVALGYHLTSTFAETHAGQTDLKIVGWPFALLFLPAANLIAFGIVLSFSLGGTSRVAEFLSQLK